MTKLSIPLACVGQFRDTIAVFTAMDTSGLDEKEAILGKDGRPAALRSEFLKIDNRKDCFFDLSSTKNGCVLKISIKDHNGRPKPKPNPKNPCVLIISMKNDNDDPL